MWQNYSYVPYGFILSASHTSMEIKGHVICKILGLIWRTFDGLIPTACLIFLVQMDFRFVCCIFFMTFCITALSTSDKVVFGLMFILQCQQIDCVWKNHATAFHIKML
jgi:hypothetical protein